MNILVSYLEVFILLFYTIEFELLIINIINIVLI